MTRAFAPRDQVPLIAAEKHRHRVSLQPVRAVHTPARVPPPAHPSAAAAGTAGPIATP